MKASGRLSAAISAACLAAHGALAWGVGTPCTQDFTTLYAPWAAQAVAWLHGAAGFPEVPHGYDLFHFHYTLFVGLIYFVFGVGNQPAVSALQVLLATGATVFIFHAMRPQFDSQALAAGCTVFSFLFFDAMFMTLVGSPESLYRSLYVAAVLTLIRLYERRRLGAFLAAAALSFVLLLGIRADTLILFVPVYTLGLNLLCGRLGWGKPSLTALSAGMLLGILSLSLAAKLDIAGHPVMQVDRHYFAEGIVVADLGAEGKIEPLEPGVRLSAYESLERGLRLFILRILQFLTLFPPSWSAAHKIYYAAHMIPLYLFALVGLLRAYRARSLFFGTVVQCYAAAILLHGLTRVDAAHRTNYVSIIFLVMLAGYGVDFLFGILRKPGRGEGRRGRPRAGVVR